MNHLNFTNTDVYRCAAHGLATAFEEGFTAPQVVAVCSRRCHC